MGYAVGVLVSLLGLGALGWWLWRVDRPGPPGGVPDFTAWYRRGTGRPRRLSAGEERRRQEQEARTRNRRPL